jgi:hypothetical protein
MDLRGPRTARMQALGEIRGDDKKAPQLVGPKSAFSFGSAWI